MYRFTVSRSYDEAHDRWYPTGELTQEEQQLLETIKAALDAGIFYNRDMFTYVCERHEFTEEEKKRGTGTSVDGILGMDIYYARYKLEKEREDKANREAFLRLDLHPGKKLGTLKFGWHRNTWRNCSVHEIDEARCQVVIQGTKGNRRYGITVNATQIERAQARLNEDKKLKTNPTFTSLTVTSLD